MPNPLERGINPKPTPELMPPLYDHPIWWHHHGKKMQVVPAEFPGELVIKGSAAEVKITRDPERLRWNVDWILRQTKHCYSQGRTEWQDDEFNGAFGFLDSMHLNGYGVIERFGGDSAELGRYIRWKNFLNIPNPGTGHDYDTNVSIFLTDNLKNEIGRFKAAYQGHPLLTDFSVPATIRELLALK